MAIVFQHRSVRTTLAMLAALGMAGCAGAQSGAQQQGAAPLPVVVQSDSDPQSDAAVVVPPVPALQEQANSTVGELQSLIQSRKVSELRTSYNGTYGASLLFQPETLTYFVALFQQKNFWRVVKTDQHAQAEQFYRNFSAETRELAEVELRGIRLQAEYAHTEQQLGQRSADLAALQNDLQAQRQQETLVAARQQQAKAQAEQLAQQQQEARKQLQALQRQIKSIEDQQAALGARNAPKGNAGRALPPK